MNKHTPLLSACLLLLPAIAFADIETLSQEELTDTYIKDTTVMVKKEAPKPEPQNQATVHLKVSPIEKEAQILPTDPVHKIDPISNEFQTYEYLNQNAALANGQIPDVEFALPMQDAGALKRDAFIRETFGYGPNEPIDYGSLLSQANQDPKISGGNSPVGASHNDNSITITIPNSIGASAQQHTSPNGEVSVNVTPNEISYTLNIPR